MQGTVRTFNQELLDKDLIEEQLIFFTLEKTRTCGVFSMPEPTAPAPSTRNT